MHFNNCLNIFINLDVGTSFLLIILEIQNPNVLINVMYAQIKKQ